MARPLSAATRGLLLVLATCLSASAFTADFSASAPADSAKEVLTTDTGAPVDVARFQETVGSRGPTLLEDTYLIEHLAVQNRERIPERTVHARGATAFGEFVLEQDLSQYTAAKFLSNKGKKTPVVVRFSTVIHGQSSPEYLRDPRGFAIKFKTEEGNFDLTGINFPVFFIRDGIRFPDMIRSLKPNPVTGVQESWRYLDFFSSVPESVNMFTYLFDDQGIPKSYRTMNGEGVHTLKLLSATSNATYVKFHLTPELGVQSFTSDEEAKSSLSFTGHTTDLYDAIERGDYPSWVVSVQLMNPFRELALSFDPLDPTKIWPERDFPSIRIGRLTLNRNVRSQFLENEQVAFSPGHFVPGIAASDDKMLQARIFSYADAHRYRLGINHQLLPVNAPVAPVFSDAHVDGQMNVRPAASQSEVNYFPSAVRSQVSEAAPIPHDPELVCGTKTRGSITRTSDDFVQAREHYLSYDVDRRERFAARLAKDLAHPKVNDIIFNRWIDTWTKVDAGLAKRIRVLHAEFRAAQQ